MRKELEKNFDILNYELDRAIENQSHTTSKEEIIDIKHEAEYKWEEKYRRCLNIPGLLLAVGLLGTFVGITINLLILGMKFNSASQEDLQAALGGMAIAFGSSLFALACNIGLTVWKPSHNITIKKEKVISSLEDYIDNVYIPGPGLQPTGLSNSTDLSNLLKELPKAVAKAVSESLTQNIQEIERSSILMEQGAEHFRDAAQHAYDILIDILMEQSAEHFRDTLITGANSLTSATKNLNEAQGQYEQSARNLSKSAQYLSESVEKLEKQFGKNRHRSWISLLMGAIALALALGTIVFLRL